MDQGQETDVDAIQGLPTDAPTPWEGEMVASRGSQIHPLWVIEIWQENREVFKTFLAHTISTLLLILALVVFEYVINKSGLSPSHKVILEEIDFYWLAIALLLFGFDFTIKLFIFSVQFLLQVWHHRSRHE